MMFRLFLLALFHNYINVVVDAICSACAGSDLFEYPLLASQKFGDSNIDLFFETGIAKGQNDYIRRTRTAGRGTDVRFTDVVRLWSITTIAGKVEKLYFGTPHGACLEQPFKTEPRNQLVCVFQQHPTVRFARAARFGFSVDGNRCHGNWKLRDGVYWCESVSGRWEWTHIPVCSTTGVACDDRALSCPADQYKHLDKCCRGCPPGERVDVPCVSCTACEIGTYTDKVNGYSMCKVCNICGVGLKLRRPCSRRSPADCVLQPNYFCMKPRGSYCDTARRYTQCRKGTFISTAGTETTDNVCKPCPPNTYTDGDNMFECLPHTTCADRGLVEKLVGTNISDTVCVPRDTFQIVTGVLTVLLFFFIVAVAVAIKFNFFMLAKKRLRKNRHKHRSKRKSRRESRRVNRPSRRPKEPDRPDVVQKSTTTTVQLDV